ncbi:MAG: DUF3261 domain-containing protein [Succinivibrio sp.]|nr:DUF3261 domain-containing protein [Succinivibrio sp.]MDY5188371.1 DUF3261 domain-containing protein [Succinivibrio sp.]
MLNKFILCLSLLLTLACTACSSSTKDEASSQKVFLEPKQSVVLPKFSYNEKLSLKQLMTTTYGDKTHSLIVFLNLDKDFIEIKGMSTSFINLFSVKYQHGIIETKYFIPKLLLPAVDQVLLDIMLCFEDDSKISQFLPQGYLVKTTKDSREILNKEGNLIYKISYEKIHEHNLAVKLTNNAFNYTVTIKYL